MKEKLSRGRNRPRKTGVDNAQISETPKGTTLIPSRRYLARRTRRNQGHRHSTDKRSSL